MKKSIFAAIFLLVASSTLCVAKSKHHKSTASKATTPLSLFYGMDYDEKSETYDYAFSAPEFENLPDVAKQELKAVCACDSDTTCWKTSLGLYVDKTFPTQVVKERVTMAVDTTVFNYSGIFCCFDHIDGGKESDFDVDKALLSSVKDEGSLPFAAALFDVITKGLAPRAGVQYSEIPHSRFCVVAHKVYEDNELVTYILCESYNFHGTNGCPSRSSYYTYEKKTGKLLTKADLVKLPRKTVETQLRSAYVKTCKSFNDTPSALTGKELFDQVSGCAIINEGLLFYYYPYSIGSGAEGQYNLIVKRK